MRKRIFLASLIVILGSLGWFRLGGRADKGTDFEIPPIFLKCPPFGLREIDISINAGKPTRDELRMLSGILLDWAELWPGIRQSLTQAMIDHESEHSLDSLMSDPKNFLRIYLNSTERQEWAVDIMLNPPRNAVSFYVEFEGRNLVQTGGSF
jgi:hypothetical protein